MQKQPSKGVLKIYSKCTGNIIEIALQHGCSPVNLLHIFRIPFLKSLKRLWSAASGNRHTHSSQFMTWHDLDIRTLRHAICAPNTGKQNDCLFYLPNFLKFCHNIHKNYSDKSGKIS